MILQQMAAFVWGPLTMGMTLGIGGYLLAATKGFPLRRFHTAAGISLRQLTETAPAGQTTPFQAMSTALGATMGTGNIVGVATALVSGGPGAVVWMWIAALVGMAIKLAEVSLAVRYRRLGAGPMGYLRLVPRIGRLLAVLFAVLCLAAALGMGNMTQSNSVAQALEQFGIDPPVVAVALFAFTMAATGGGVRGIVRLSAWLVPIVTAGYTALSAVALWQNREFLLPALEEMVGQAFGLRAAAGGAAGYTLRSAMRFGVARGVFSNEAGMGSAPIAYAEANSRNAVEQGMWGILEVFIDTCVSCTLTALVLLTAGGGAYWRICGLTGAPLASACFARTLGTTWGTVVSGIVAMFGVASICGWFAYGQRALESLLGARAPGRLYRLMYAVGAALGALLAAEPVWMLCDLFTGLMMMVNLTGVLVLAPQVCEMIAEWERGYRR